MCHTPIRHGPKPANLPGMSFKEPIPALSNVMDTNEHASPNANVVSAIGVASAYIDRLPEP